MTDSTAHLSQKADKSNASAKKPRFFTVITLNTDRV